MGAIQGEEGCSRELTPAERRREMPRPTGIFKKPPIFMPKEYHAEFHAIPKAAQTDMLYNLAMLLSGMEREQNTAKAIKILRREWAIVKEARK